MSDSAHFQHDSSASDAAGRPRRRRANKVTAVLGPDRSVTLIGSDLSFTGIITMLDELLVRAKRARAQSLRVDTFLRVLADQSGAPPTD